MTRLILSILAIAHCAAFLPVTRVGRAADDIAGKEVIAEGLTGRLVRYENFKSEFVAPRNVDVWLPPGFDDKKTHSVLFMHDGQNLFIPELSYTKIDWGVDETAARLISEGTIRDVIVVGIWNTSNRFGEYMPQKAVRYASSELLARTPKEVRDSIDSDDYLRFIVNELKPFIDKTYPTRPGRNDTFVMGSSMGGLISCYAISEYPEVFGGAGCVSTHWPAGEGIVVDYFRDNLAASGKHKIYFDFGTEGLDAQYEQYQKKMDKVMVEKGYVAGRNWITRKFDGADHSERAWSARLNLPLTFLLGKQEK